MRNFENIFFYSFPHNAGIFRALISKLRAYLETYRFEQERVFDKDMELDEIRDQLKKAKNKNLVGCVSGLYSKFDAFELERIFGTKTMKRMITKKNKAHIFEF